MPTSACQRVCCTVARGVRACNTRSSSPFDIYNLFREARGASLLVNETRVNVRRPATNDCHAFEVIPRWNVPPSDESSRMWSRMPVIVISSPLSSTIASVQGQDYAATTREPTPKDSWSWTWCEGKARDTSALSIACKYSSFSFSRAAELLNQARKFLFAFWFLARVQNWPLGTTRAADCRVVRESAGLLFHPLRQTTRWRLYKCSARLRVIPFS